MTANVDGKIAEKGHNVQFINLIDFNNFVRKTETKNGVNYPLKFAASYGVKLDVPKDGLVLTPSEKTIGTTMFPNAGMAGAANIGSKVSAEWY